MHGVDWYDFEARMLDSKGGGFTTMDPLAEKYYSWSPYAYCLGNPVRNVDPTGMDVWELNNKGEIVRRIKDTTQDAFYMVARDENGNYERTYTTDSEGNKTYNSISFEYGTVTDVRKPTIRALDKNNEEINQNLTIFEIKGDDNATQLFEFMAKPNETTNVEWTHAKIGTKDSGRNVVGTSHSQSSTSVGRYLRDKNYALKEVIHNHPSGVGSPSLDDRLGAILYHTKNPNTLLMIYTHPKKYTKYDRFKSPF